MARLRREKGLSHDALAERLDRARPNVIAWEKGRRVPTPHTLMSIAAALEVDPRELTTATMENATLADLRAWAGLYQDELASRCGLTRSTYALIERGEVDLQPDVAKRLAKALGRGADEVRRAHGRRRPAERQPVGRGGETKGSTTRPAPRAVRRRSKSAS